MFSMSSVGELPRLVSVPWLCAIVCVLRSRCNGSDAGRTPPGTPPPSAEAVCAIADGGASETLRCNCTLRPVAGCAGHRPLPAGCSRLGCDNRCLSHCDGAVGLCDLISGYFVFKAMADESAFTEALLDTLIWYHRDRPHDHLQGQTPAEVWAGMDVFASRSRTHTAPTRTNARRESG